MFVFGVCIDSQETFDRRCLPAIAAFGGEDATLMTTTDKPIAHAYNEMLTACLDLDDVEAIVLLREDVEITDPRFRSKIRAAFAEDARLAILGPTGPRIRRDPRRSRSAPASGPREVDSIDGLCMILRPHLAGRLRFDETAFTGTSGYDVDFCYRVRGLGYSVAVDAIDVTRHGGHEEEEAYRQAAVVWQGKHARLVGSAALARILDHAPPPLPQESAPVQDYAIGHPELLEHLPPGVTRVLDVGCGAGTLGAAIKAATGAHVVGLEFGDAPRRLAATRLDAVHRVDLAHARILPCEPASFDTLVLAGVLERVVDPEGLLRLVLPYLAPGGHVIATIPNVRHWSVVLPLILTDRWEYRDEGPLRPSSLRFFTMLEAAALFRRVGLGGFEVCAAHQVPLAEPEQLDPLLDVVAGFGVDREEAQTLFDAFQYIVVAVRDRPE